MPEKYSSNGTPLSRKTRKKRINSNKKPRILGLVSFNQDKTSR